MPVTLGRRFAYNAVMDSTVHLLEGTSFAASAGTHYAAEAAAEVYGAGGNAADAAVAAAAAVVGLVSPRGLGFGDVKLLGLLGILLGWFGWSVLGLGVVLGFFVGALGTVVLLVLRRAGWRSEVALGPSLLLGAALALLLVGT